MTSPLAGIRVLDLTHFVAGPWCTQMLADLGAEVIKVEPPDGEIGRSMGAVFRSGESAIFLGFNRGKQAITLDLKRSEDQRRARDLVLTCDVLVHNYRPRTAERLGMGADALRTVHPGLVYCDISAYGPDGPAAGRPANDPVIQALTGAMDETGVAGGAPVRMGVSLPDFGAAALATNAILAALLRRTTTGEGCHIDLNLLDAQLYAQTDLMTSRSDEPLPSRARAELGARTCTDGEVWIDSPYQDAVNRALGVPDGAVAEDTLGGIDRGAAARVLGEAGIPAAPVHRLAEALPGRPDHSVLVQHPRVGALRQLSTPLRAAPPWPPATTPPPLLGEHNDLHRPTTEESP